MELPEKIEILTQNLPDAESARRFFAQSQEKHPAEARKLLRPENQGLLSDILAVAAWSPFLATTVLQHKEYISWLARKRTDAQIPSKEDLLESLARFSLTNSTLDAHVLLARFRRRELLRIYLRDIRALATVAEITEELSNLADAVLEFALKIARQEMENRFGSPLETDEKGRTKTAQFCVVALGKLGSKELNYASDIDLLFLYSADGATSGTGTRGVTTNKEFFVKLSERAAKIVGETAGEGAAYRVDLRLRPHGRVGSLAVSVKEAVAYYQKSARDWERQVLLRSRAAAGDAEVFKNFYSQIEMRVFRADVSVSAAVHSVRESKQKINQEYNSENGFNVKLGKGGIREIEFIAQALQLAYGGRDQWLRAPHTLISLSRLADRKVLSESELTALADAYSFLRMLEHRLQMEQGLQTHTVPDDENKRALVARRMKCPSLSDFDKSLQFHTTNVNQIFERIFVIRHSSFVNDLSLTVETIHPIDKEQTEDEEQRTKDKGQRTMSAFCEISPHFGEMLAANPTLIDALPEENAEFEARNYSEILTKAVTKAANFHEELAALRTAWSKFYLEIAAFDAFEKISMRESNRLQTELAEAGLKAALLIVQNELKRRFKELQITNYELRIAVLGLGRLGSGGMDYGSDLDLVLVYDERQELVISDLTPAEFYARAAEILVTALSSLTREGLLYRVDLRLRPDGKNGATASAASSFLNYLEKRSVIWEWLAYVKLRAVGGDLEFAGKIEREARKVIHEKAKQSEIENLKFETKRIRDALEQQKAKGLRRGEIDIKYGAGGLLDVYFALRFLQLRDAVFDEEENRTTSFTLKKLREAGSLDAENFEILSGGYEFLREIDHAVRLIAGRSTRLPASASSPLLSKIAERLKFDSATELLSNLAFHTANLRGAFENLLS